MLCQLRDKMNRQLVIQSKAKHPKSWYSTSNLGLLAAGVQNDGQLPRGAQHYHLWHSHLCSQQCQRLCSGQGGKPRLQHTLCCPAF